MEFLNRFLSEYGLPLISAVLTALFGYLGMVAKRLFEKYVTDRQKEQVVATCVKAVEQLYRDLGGEEKLKEAVSAATQMLAQKGISVGELELRMLIEAAVLEYRGAFLKSAEKAQK